MQNNQLLSTYFIDFQQLSRVHKPIPRNVRFFIYILASQRNGNWYEFFIPSFIPENFQFLSLDVQDVKEKEDFLCMCL